MRKILGIVLFIFIPILSFSQLKESNQRYKSWKTLVYQIPAKEAEQYILWDSVPVNQFLNRKELLVFGTDTVDLSNFPNGNYVCIKADNNKLVAELTNISNLRLVPNINQLQLQIAVNDKFGNIVQQADVFINQKKLLFNPNSKIFYGERRDVDNGLVVVYTANDTLLANIDYEIDERTTEEVKEELKDARREKFKQSGFYKIINWVPSIFSTKKKKSSKIFRNQQEGMMVFNQPKYKPLDTVKFKAYFYDDALKPYSKEVQVFLSYSQNGSDFQQKLFSLKPISAGAYTAEFVLSDTLPTDRNYFIKLKNNEGKQLLSKSFKAEDYILSEINSYKFESINKVYGPNDSLRFAASAKDANGLAVLDGTAELILTTKSVESFFKDSLFIPDTLYQNKIKLASVGDTKFIIPTDGFPNANMEIKGLLNFRNSNNEIQTKEVTIEYVFEDYRIEVQLINDSIYADYLINNVKSSIGGTLELMDKEEKIRFPYVAKISPFEDNYNFNADDENLTGQKFSVPDYQIYRPNNFSSRDTTGFDLYNPKRVHVFFSVLKNNQVIAEGSSAEENLKWRMKTVDPNEMYFVRYSYWWTGELRKDYFNIGLLYKQLNIEAKSKQTVFPGEKDSIQLSITDYLGKPAADVNLTAVSYNSQFAKDIRLPSLPNLSKYKKNNSPNHSTVETDQSVYSRYDYPIVKHKQFLKKLDADTMPYYQLLLPDSNYTNQRTLLEGFLPQLFVHLVDKGNPEEIFLLYINKNLVYYNGVTKKFSNAISVYPGMNRIGIRTRTHFIDIDSIYIQSHYKHDISFDFNNLPKNAIVQKVDTFYSNKELDVLNNTLWRSNPNWNPNGGYLWQNNRVLELDGYRNNIIGPFNPGSLTYFRPGDFDINFDFEGGYTYSISKEKVRLEKENLFPNRALKYFLVKKNNSSLLYGDTLVNPPIIEYNKKPQIPTLKVTDYALTYKERSSQFSGQISYRLPYNVSVQTIVLKNADSSKYQIIRTYYQSLIYNLPASKYDIWFINTKGEVAELNSVNVKVNGTLYISQKLLNFKQNNTTIQNLFNIQDSLQNLPILDIKIEGKVTIGLPYDSLLKYSKEPKLKMNGVVMDLVSRYPIPFAVVRIKGTNIGVSTDEKGQFSIADLLSGKFKLIISAVGYESKEYDGLSWDESSETKSIYLYTSENSLQEVIVTTAFGMQTQKRSLGFSTSIINSHSLEGRMLGLSVQPSVFNDDKITLRGLKSFTGNSSTLVILDGIIVPSSKLNEIKPELITDVVVLSAAEATSIYGPDGVNGAIVITTNVKTDRKVFKDYATWQPNFYSDKNGKAAYEITYPDNVTSWSNYVIAIDKKGRTGIGSFTTNSYRPIVAQLNMPLFMLESDSVMAVAKVLNHTSDKYTVNTSFSSGTEKTILDNQTLPANDALIQYSQLNPVGKDTVVASFSISSTTGFKDAEERKIPVFKNGTYETIGNFWVLKNDSVVQWKAQPNLQTLTIHAQNNNLDLLLEEIELLKNYPHACMEQTASKLTGLAMKKNIYTALDKKFEDDKMMKTLLSRIQKSQLYNGAWSWWPNGNANLNVTNYIVKSLIKLKDAKLNETQLRSAFLYMQNQLHYLDKNSLLSTLITLSEGQFDLDYDFWLKKLNFDSLSIHGKWNWVKIKQQRNLPYLAQLEILVKQQQQNSILGGVYWGDNNYRWYSNQIATTTVAFSVLEEAGNYNQLLPKIIQYFLELRKRGRWSNTVESASIVETILPYLLKQNSKINEKPFLKVSGDTSFIVNTFPFHLKLNNNKIQELQLQQKGGGIMYSTIYQQQFNPAPKPVNDQFVVNSYFEKSGQKLISIKAGDKVNMILEIEAVADADYVMVEIPIPAGCIYANKENGSYMYYKEFYKDKMLLFAESLPKGKHKLVIELESRYGGKYTINPAKVELMYYPTFYGRNGIQSVIIEN